ncbi:odorant receptor 131-2-like [Rana temporaria]|uniref:odorant receptor 131-2-like n=1 Tax=Rana temporaria TaxID=8407 RepID=UPI001AADC477|nr:odorant receptor 131-2-like [Rana temporaria]
MVISNGIPPNITKVSAWDSINMEVLRTTITSSMFTCIFFFLLFMAAMLTIFFTNSVARETTRYILFIHMLINDAAYLCLALLLFVCFAYQVTFPVPVCYLIVTLSSTTIKVTPYNLAVMSLERYVAICFPLRHGEFCTVPRTFLAIALVWTICLIPNVADFIILCSSVNKRFFLLYAICSRSTFTIIPMQEVIRIFAYVLAFSLTGLVILFTYIRITLIALRIFSKKESASKAAKTMMLHAVQLMLCMSTFGYSIVELFTKDNLVLLPSINFCFFMCLPRFISIFIYGARDELFFGYLKRCFVRSASKIVPSSAT